MQQPDGALVSPPFPTSRVLVISDFNCPYCFTLNEWIHELGASELVRWVGVEHRPDLPEQGANTSADRKLLLDEVSDVQRRAPEVGALRPEVWINSRYALLVQNAVEDEAPELAPVVRRGIFQRIWRSGSAVELYAAVSETLAEVGLEPPEVEDDWLDELSGWWKTHLDRIPCMVGPTGVAHRGLQDRASVQAFLQSALRTGSIGPGCR
jgi:predicted DsbA family dithiol-disulfide isomerase